MNVAHRLWPRLALLSALVFFLHSVPAAAVNADNFMVAALGGIGGSPDVKPGQTYTNPGFQFDFSHIAEPQTLVGAHFGELSLDSKPNFGSLLNAKLQYADVGAEYRFQETYYESGIFIGLGAYRLSGTALDGGSNSQTAVGGVLAITGEFKMTRMFGLLFEFSGHYADFRNERVFVMAHGGLSVHF